MSEAGKLFERIIYNRVERSLDSSGGIAGTQYGFRPNRSTIEAIWRLRSIVDDTVRDGGVVLAVSFDIANCFNSLPWPVIRRALVEKEVSGYLRRVLDGYL